MWNPLEPTTKNHFEHILFTNGSRVDESKIKNSDEEKILIEEV